MRVHSVSSEFGLIF